MSETEITYWYVVYTKPRWEKKVSRTLTERGIINYCPLNKVRRKWSDRVKTILEPLFKGYVFIKVPEAEKWNIKSVEGILNYVYWLGKPARVKDGEIDTIKKFLMEFENVEVAEFQLTPNQEVVIRQGVLMDFRGVIIEVLGNKARVRIDSLGMQLSAVFDKKALEPLLKQ